MNLKAIIRQKVMVPILLCSMLCSSLIVHAEEAVSEEEIAISGNFDSVTSEISKSDENINHKIYVGENMDINAMPAAEVSNTDPNHAGLIPPNSIVSDAITEAGQQRWYALETDGGKLTLDLNFENSANVDYDVLLYQYNSADGVITMIDKSDTTDKVEHFARIVDSGIYFIMVNGYSGYDAANKYSLAVIVTAQYDGQEVDDRLQDAYSFMDVGYSVTGTIDNDYDIDIQKYEVRKAGKVHIYLKNDNGSGNVYAMDVLGPDGARLATLKQNIKYDTDLPQCTIYFKVYCSTYRNDPNSTYTLSGDTRVQAASVAVTHAGDAAEPIKDYVGGPYWRVYPNSYVEGVAYDSNGRPLADADVTILVEVEYNKQEIPANGRTDSQGKFKIQLENIGSGVGMYNTNVSGVARHFYDIVKVRFESNGASIPANVDHFYHFAYEYLL